MHQVVIFETLQFLSRDDLDACQLCSSYCRDLVARSAKFRSVLRHIHRVTLIECHMYATVTVSRTGDAFGQTGRFLNRHEPLVAAEDYADLLRLFDHSFVDKFAACFACNGGFLDHWLRHKDEVGCRINGFSTTYVREEIFGDRDVYLLYNDISEWLFDARRLQTCDIVFELCSPTLAIAEWIDSIVERFENTAAIVPSLAIMWLLEDVSDENNLPRMRRLQMPQSIAARPSRKEFVASHCRRWYAGDVTESPACLFRFHNSVDDRVLHVYKWIVTDVTSGLKNIALLFEPV